GSSNYNPPSRFLSELPADLVRSLDRGREEEGRPNGGRDALGHEPLPVTEGDTVYHDKWGEGVVLTVSGSGQRTEATISFDDVRVWEQAAAVTQDVRREVRERARVARQSRSRSGGGSRSRERKRSDHPRTRERSAEGPRAGGDGWPPDSPVGRGSDRRRKRR